MAKRATSFGIERGVSSFGATGICSTQKSHGKYRTSVANQLNRLPLPNPSPASMKANSASVAGSGTVRGGSMALKLSLIQPAKL
jgi:hypothetical protein